MPVTHSSKEILYKSILFNYAVHIKVHMTGKYMY